MKPTKLSQLSESRATELAFDIKKPRRDAWASDLWGQVVRLITEISVVAVSAVLADRVTTFRNANLYQLPDVTLPLIREVYEQINWHHDNM